MRPIPWRKERKKKKKKKKKREERREERREKGDEKNGVGRRRPVEVQVGAEQDEDH